MLGAITRRAAAAERVAASLAAAVCAAERGAFIVRVHDVEQTVDAIKSLVGRFAMNQLAGTVAIRENKQMTRNYFGTDGVRARSVKRRSRRIS